MGRSRVEVIHVGSAARDVAPDDPRGWRLGGGVTYAALTTARLGLETAAIIGVDDAAARADELDSLRAAGVDLLLVPLDEGPVFHNVETPSGREQTCLSIGRPIRPLALPESWRRTAAWSFTPVAGEIDDDWTELVPPGSLVALGWQGLLRDLEAGVPVGHAPPVDRAVARRADIVGVSRHDVAPSTSIGTLASYLHPGARLLLTQGHHGGLLIDVGPEGPASSLRYLPTRTDREVDATGAGDTFLAALVAATVRPSVMGLMRRRVGADLRFAAAAGSLAVEGTGLAGVPDLLAVRARAVRERVRRLVVPSELAQVRVEAPID